MSYLSVSCKILCLLVCLIFVLFSLISHESKSKNLSSSYGNATIYYADPYSIPYIKSVDSYLAVFHALGYAHAENRLLDLQIKRIMCYGRLSEYFGKDVIGPDKFIRSLDLVDAAKNEIKEISKEKLDIVEAYSRGINDYVEQLRVFPLEFQILGLDFSPWTILDSILLIKMFEFEMTTHWQVTSLRTGLWKKYFKEKYGIELAEFISLGITDLDNEFITQTSVLSNADYPWFKKDNTKNANTKKTESMFTEFLKKMYPKTVKGSNSWVIHGNYTETGKPLLVADPHLDYMIPSVMYLAALEFPDHHKAFGCTVPGLPTIVLGRNSFVAWSATMSMVENIDLYDITLNKEKTKYYHDNQWKDVEIKKNIIKVKGEKDVLYDVIRTHHGPILDCSSKDSAVMFS